MVVIYTAEGKNILPACFCKFMKNLHSCLSNSENIAWIFSTFKSWYQTKRTI